MRLFFFKCFLFFSSLFTLNATIAQPLVQALSVSTAIEAQADVMLQGGQTTVLARQQGLSKPKVGLSSDAFVSKVDTLNLDQNSSLRAASSVLTDNVNYFINDHQILADVVAYQYRRALLHIFTRSRDLINLS